MTQYTGTRRRIIHMGDAGLGRLKCGAAPTDKKPILGNWRWRPEDVTCKKCLKIYHREIAERG